MQFVGAADLNQAPPEQVSRTDVDQRGRTRQRNVPKGPPSQSPGRRQIQQQERDQARAKRQGENHPFPPEPPHRLQSGGWIPERRQDDENAG